MSTQKFDLDPHQRGAIFLLANTGAAEAVGWKPSDDGCPAGTCFTDDEGWKISLDPGRGDVPPSFNIYDADGNLRGNEDSFPEAALSAANKQEVPDVDPDNDGDIDASVIPAAGPLGLDTDDDDDENSGDEDDDQDSGALDLDNLDVAALIKLLGGIIEDSGEDDSPSGVVVIAAPDDNDDSDDDSDDDDDDDSGDDDYAMSTDTFASKKAAPVLAFDQVGNILGLVDAKNIQQVQTIEPSMQNPMAGGFPPAPVEDSGAADAAQAAPAAPAAPAPVPTVDANGNPIDPSMQTQTVDANGNPLPQPPAATPAMAADGTFEFAAAIRESFAKAKPTGIAATATENMVPVYDKDGNLIGVVEASAVQPLQQPAAPGNQVQVGQPQTPGATAAEGVQAFAAGTLTADGEAEVEMDEDEIAELRELAASVEYWRDYTDATRQKQAKKGIALPDGSFPIANGKDLANAIKSVGRAKNPAKAKAHIMKRARALKQTDKVPSSWATESEIDEELELTFLDSDLSGEQYEPEQRALVASGAEVLAAPIAPPKAWFTREEADGPTPLTITDDGQVYGHLATWDVCHLAMPNGVNECVTAPKSDTDYSLFHLGVVKTEEGAEVPVGRITMNTTHAGDAYNSRRAIAHYENTGLAVADVHAKNGKFGIWLAGAVRPDATPAQLRALKASPLSGDWRRTPRGSMELVMALAVNQPGFPIPRPQGLVASGALQSLVAAGMLPPKQVIKPGKPGAFSVEDLRYLKSIIQREKEAAETAELSARAQELHARAVEAASAARVAAFGYQRRVALKQQATLAARAQQLRARAGRALVKKDEEK